jgi:putative ABC transport system permease protein
MKVIAGRDFSRSISTDAEEAFLINETAVKDFGLGTPEKAIGHEIGWQKWGGDSSNPIKRGRVIGVVKDFHYSSLHEKVASSVIIIYPQQLFKVAVKLQTADMKSTLAFINDAWNRYVPGYPLDYKFMDETYGKMYNNEEKLGDLLFIFTIMAIIVGCMGLFALAAFSTEQRVKEIGIRKVLGASIFNLTALLSKSFMRLVLIATVISFPLAWWAMNNWLENFPYRVSISPWIFVLAALLAVAIALFTVSLQTVKAALANPVKNLRTE